ncbi:hypothetical protein CSA37_04010 [Candidatus Fermentibacteria bacterium]|nr:MAG: hypothetical protein CSA37_10705 [Candidatus Fermentibacteria bacterium]PIE52817.1 MAG: hypothetical protein CSA37_04010 [Candidatus Fermentibacteria bacterium]
MISRNTLSTLTAAAAGLLLVLAVTYSSPVQRGGYYILSDPLGSLLVTQNIIDEGSVQLDRYSNWRINEEEDLKYQIIDGHVYSYFPVGSSIAAIPAVAAANILGRHMSVIEYETWMNCVLASVTLGILFLLVFLALKNTYGMFPSLAFSLAAVLSTPVTSTVGAAYWSVNPVVLLFTLAIIGVQKRWNGYLTGSILFFSVVCRPQSSVFTVLFLIYMFFRERNQFYRAVSALVTGTMLFIIFSMNHYSRILPEYFSPARAGSFQLEVFFQLLISPSRGILVFFPQGILICAAVPAALREYRLELVLCITYLLLMMGVVSGFPHWWGGVSYGPRLLVDTMPVWFLTALITWSSLKGMRKLFLATGILLSIAGGFINLKQGLHNPSTALWNTEPVHIDIEPEKIADWNDPQFLR